MGLVGIGLASAPRDSSKTANAKYRCAPAAVDTDGARVGVSAGGVQITTKISALPGQPVVHAHGIGSRGKWIPGLLDPTANGRSQSDGFNLLQIYRNLGLDLDVAMDSEQSGVCDGLQRMRSGRLRGVPDAGEFLPAIPVVSPRRTWPSSEAERPVDELP